MRKVRIFAAILCIAALALSLAACKGKAPEKIELSEKAFLMGSAGETLNIKEKVTVTGNADAKLKYSVSDPAVAEVSEDGVITAKGFGSAVITISAEADENVNTSADILVYPYAGKYAGTKYIDAMGCDITVEITLNSDGTYEYYRAPMNVALEGGGEMPELTDAGTFVVTESEFVFTGEYLGEFKLSFKIASDSAALEGSVPTGGAPTQMQLMLDGTKE